MKRFMCANGPDKKQAVQMKNSYRAKNRPQKILSSKKYPVKII